MSTRNTRPVRRAAAGVLAGTLALSGAAVAATASPANALPGFTLDRIEGLNRYETAANIAADAFPTGAPVAIVARGDVFADALAANYLAGALGAPILLTGSKSLPGVTADALADLGVEDVIIVGGTTAVSTDVERALEANYGVDRLGGTDRYETAALIAVATAQDVELPVGEVNGLRTAILGNGQNFPDVLAAAPLSYAGGHPLVISRPDGLPDDSAAVLEALDIEQVLIVGGPVAVSDDVETDAERITGNPAIRVFGDTRYETAAEIADFAYDELGFDEAHVNIARGDQFADALTGGPHAGEEMAPIVLVTPTELRPATKAFLENHSDTLVDGHIFGGLLAVSKAVEEAAEDAATGPEDVTDPGPAVITAPLTATTTGNATIAITGTAEAGATVRVLRGTTQVGTGTADATSGAFSVTATLVEGANDLVVVVADAAGNTSTATAVPTVTRNTVDTTAPTAAAVTTPNAATRTNAATFAIAGTAEAGATVNVLRAGDRTVAGTGTAADNGAFSVNATLADGANDFVVVVEDAAGNKSTDTVVPTITQDTVAPTATLTVGDAGTNTITVTYNERIRNSTATVQDFTLNGTELTATTATIDTDFNATLGGDVTTVTLTAPLVAGDVIVLEADAVADLAGNRAPAQPLTGTASA